MSLTIPRSASNPAFALLLGISPALAGTRTFSDAIVLGMVTVSSMALMATVTPPIRARCGTAFAEFALFAIAAAFAALFSAAIKWSLPIAWEPVRHFIWLVAFGNLVVSAMAKSVGDTWKRQTTMVLAVDFLGGILAYGLVRELLAFGSLSLPSATVSLTAVLFPSGLAPVRFLALPAGGLFLAGFFAALARKLFRPPERRADEGGASR